MNWQHYIADGEACFQMMQDWGDIYRAAGDIDGSASGQAQPAFASLPVLDRSWLTPLVDSSTLSFDASSPSEGGFIHLPDPVDLRTAPAPPPVKVRVIRFSARELANMKRAVDRYICAPAPAPAVASAAAAGEWSDAASASSPSSSSPPSDRWLSTFEVMTAHLLRCMHLARSCPEADAITTPLQLSVTCNLRARLARAPKEPFFGNAVLPAHVSLPVELMGTAFPSAAESTAALVSAATLVHDAVASLTPSVIDRTLSWLANLPRKDCLVEALELHRGLIVSAWHKFAPHALCFESNEPAAFVAPLFAVDGLAIVMDSASRDGSVDIHLAMLPEHIERLCSDKSIGLHQFVEA